MAYRIKESGRCRLLPNRKVFRIANGGIIFLTAFANNFINTFSLQFCPFNFQQPYASNTPAQYPSPHIRQALKPILERFDFVKFS